MKKVIQHSLWLALFCSATCIGFSASYFYQLYLHNEYYAEPPGFPSKVALNPIIASFSASSADQWHEDRFAAGLIQSLRFSNNTTWIEFITAYGKEHTHLNYQQTDYKHTRRGWDDFLIDIGHNFLDETGKKQFMFHWLFGIPIAHKVTLAEIEQPLWGTRTFTTGPIVEVAYDFVRNIAEDLFVGALARFLHSFKRHYEPILPANAYLYPGRSIDFLALLHYRYYAFNIEFGYIYTTIYDSKYRFVDHIQKLPGQHYNCGYIDLFYYIQNAAMSIEVNVSKIWGKPYDGYTLYFSVAKYF